MSDTETFTIPRVFDLDHRLQHPDDDDVELPGLKGKSLPEIQLIVGVNNARIASYVRKSGCSLNEARALNTKYREEHPRKPRQQPPEGGTPDIFATPSTDIQTRKHALQAETSRPLSPQLDEATSLHADASRAPDTPTSMRRTVVTDEDTDTSDDTDAGVLGSKIRAVKREIRRRFPRAQLLTSIARDTKTHITFVIEY